MDLDNQNLTQVCQELKTLRDYIRWAYSRFNATNLYYGHGTDNAWDEAVHLVLASLHLPPEATSDLMDAKLTMVERRHVCELILRRINERVPVPYLTQEAWFAGLPFFVDQRVIIPRSPIAELIEQGFSPWLNREVGQILDLCTGSGCIAIACAYAFPESQIDAVDISSDALDVAHINLKKHHVEEQVHLIQSDLFDKIDQQYDLIVSNPPYVAHEEYTELPHEYLHEPSISLKADEEGIDVVRRILKDAAHYLHPSGILIVEVGNSELELTERYPEVPFLWLDFERGGRGVFLLTAEQLTQYHHVLSEN